MAGLPGRRRSAFFVPGEHKQIYTQGEVSPKPFLTAVANVAA
jgi:hypothetical protein